MQVFHVNVKPLKEVVTRQQVWWLVVLNNDNTISAPKADELASTGQVNFDISPAEQVGALEQLLKNIPLRNVVSSSHSPFSI